MTTPNTVNYPSPADWQHFERLSIAIMTSLFNKRFRQYGRNGQRQDGVDLYCRYNGQFIAVQCKGRAKGYGSHLLLEDIDKAVKSTKNFPVKIDQFYILTTGPDDTKLEKRVFEINHDHREIGSFTVHILGWQSIENIIRENESIQRKFYNGFFKRFSVKQYSVMIAITCFFITGSILGSYNYLNNYNKLSEQKDVTLEKTNEFIALNDDLIKIYTNCSDMMAPRIISSSFELKQFCIIPIAKQLDAIDKFVQKSSLSVDARAYENMKRALNILREDYRQALITVKMTGFFEDSIIREMKTMCLSEERRSKQLFDGTRKTAEDIVAQQLQFYFILNDFILPGMKSMEAITLVSALQISEQPVPLSIIEQANHFDGILKERSEYKMNKPDIPFTLSVLKIYSSRNIKMASSLPDSSEEMRWSNVLSHSIKMSFWGRENDVKELVACGVFIPEVVEQFKVEENEIKMKAESI